MRRDERGAAVPMGVAMMGLIAFVAISMSVIAGAIVTNRKVQAGADLAALAGAVAIQRHGIACDDVRASAERNEVDVVECEVEGEAVRVKVSRKTAKMFDRQLTIEAEARAGPQ